MEKEKEEIKHQCEEIKIESFGIFERIKKKVFIITLYINKKITRD